MLHKIASIKNNVILNGIPIIVIYNINPIKNVPNIAAKPIPSEVKLFATFISPTLFKNLGASHSKSKRTTRV